MSAGSREHLLTALWEYVILLEVAHRVLRDDRTLHVHNHNLNGPYHELDVFWADQVEKTTIAEGGDFSSRLDRVLQHVEEKLRQRKDFATDGLDLSNPVVVEILHTVDLRQLQNLLTKYMEHKKGLWVLVDNLDKGWPATGVSEDDTRIIRSLQSALFKIEKPFRRTGVDCHGIVFVRSDVHDNLIDATPDKGKLSKVRLDLSNREILKEILRLRFSYSLDQDAELDPMWRSLFVSHIGKTAEETCEFLIDRCLMRPRCLLDLVNACRSNAVTLGRDKVSEDDIREGLTEYSVELAANIGFEVRDVYKSGKDVIYALIGSHQRISKSELDEMLTDYGVTNLDEFTDLLLWYGVLGAVDSAGHSHFIYNERYQMQKLKAVHQKLKAGANPVYEINPAFWAALELEKL